MRSSQKSVRWLWSLVLIFALLLATRVITISSEITDYCAGVVSYPVLWVQQRLVAPFKRWQDQRRALHEVSALVAKYEAEYSRLLAAYVAVVGTEAYQRESAAVAQFAERYRVAAPDKQGTNVPLIAHIMLREISDTSHSFLLDCGAQRGVELDMVAVVHNCLVGRVSEVYPYHCRVTLVTDRHSKVPALCAATGAHGIYEGVQQLATAQLAFVSHLQQLQIGDLVISSGDGLVYPKGFALGKVASFALDAQGLTYRVTVEPLLDIRDVEFCCLVRKGTEYLGAHEVPTTEAVTAIQGKTAPEPSSEAVS